MPWTRGTSQPWADRSTSSWSIARGRPISRQSTIPSQTLSHTMSSRTQHRSAPTARSAAQYQVRGHVYIQWLFPSQHYRHRTAERGNRRLLLPNEFPYYLEPNLRHYVLWSEQRDLTQEGIEEVIAKELPNVDYVYWINPPALQSIPGWLIRSYFTLSLTSNNRL